MTLTDIICQYSEKSIEWGKFDCCIFTASVVEQFTGHKLPLWRDLTNYTSYKDALRKLRKNGINSLEELPTAILGTPKQDISKVKLGNPVYYINDKGEGVLGVCNGARAYFLHHNGGLAAVPIKNCKYCWSLPK